MAWNIVRRRGAWARPESRWGHAFTISPRFAHSDEITRDERGVATIEYALVCALIALAAVTGVSNLRGGVSEQWSSVDTRLSNAIAKNSHGAAHGNANGHGHGPPATSHGHGSGH